MLMMIMENLCAVDIKCYTAEPGQRELPRLGLEVGGNSTLQAAKPGKLKSPALQSSRWPDPGVNCYDVLCSNI